MVKKPFPHGITEVWKSETKEDCRKWLRIFVKTCSPGSRVIVRETEGSKHPFTILIAPRGIDQEKVRQFINKRWKHTIHYTAEEFVNH